jgi:hypothetical protein
LTEKCIIPDKELNTDELNWEVGDVWVVFEHNGKKSLHKAPFKYKEKEDDRELIRSDQ